MLHIEANTEKVSTLMQAALFFAAKENTKEVTDIKNLYEKLETIAEYKDEKEYIKIVDHDTEIIVKHYLDENWTVNIIELNP